MKRLLISAALFSAFAVSAQTAFTSGNLKFETNDDGPWTVTLTGTTASANETISIPENVSDGDRQYIVTRIGDGAFQKSKIAGEVKIPATVTHIGTSAFKNATAISSVVIPKSVVWMGDDAFYNCYALSYIYLGAQPEYEYTHRSRYEKYSFAFASAGRTSGGLTLEIGPDVRVIELMLFAQSHVTELKFSAGSQCEEIADGAFKSNPLTGTLDLPETVKTIGQSAFFESQFSCVRVPRGVTSVGDLAFANNAALERVEWSAEAPEAGQSLFSVSRGTASTFDVVFGPDVRIIPNQLFDFNNEAKRGSGLRSVTWPAESKIEEIGISAFSGNVALSGDLGLPLSVRKVGAEAFSYCSGLTSVTLHSGIEEMGSDLLMGCVGIETLNYDVPHGVAPFSSVGFDTYGYSTERGMTVRVGSNVKEIPAYFLHNAEDMPLKVLLADAVSLESIGELAFAACSNLTFDSLRFADGLKTIARDAFSGQITADVRIPASLNPVESGTFSAITATSLSMASSDFEHLGGIRIEGPLVIECGVSGIHKNLFANQGITSLTFADGSVMEQIGEQAFRNTPIAGPLVLPDGIQEIGGSAFAGCRGLTSLELPLSVDSIASGAFSGCEGITGELTLPAGLRIIGSEAFKDCKGIDGALTIPASVDEIGGSAFEGTSLTGVVIEDSEKPLVFNDNFRATGSWIIKAPSSRAAVMGPGLHPGQFRNVSELYVGRNLTYLCGVMYQTGVTRNYFSPFNGFTHFDKVTLAKHCDKLLEYMFAGADNCVFSELVVESETPPAVDKTTFALIDRSKCKLTVPAGSEQTYASTPVWKDFFIVGGIGEIADDASRSIVSIHSLSGVNLGSSTELCTKGGVYLIRYSDGSVKKIRL